MNIRIIQLVMAGLMLLNIIFTESDFCKEIRTIYKTESASMNGNYNMACCSALENETDAAFKFLQLAIERGFRDLAWIQSDSDLTSLNTDKRWADILVRVHQNINAYLEHVNRELYTLYQEDQGDRSGGSIDWGMVSDRDEKRRARVNEILISDTLTHSDDYYHAAMIFQHGYTSDHYKKAYKLALRSVELNAGNAAGKWLSCAAEDRYMHSLDLPQIWGTQFRRDNGESPWTMEPFDRSLKTDEQRKAMGVRSLSESQARLNRMNGVE